jgi:hypothetical protein
MLITDHEPLKWLMITNTLNVQYTRWAAQLREYTFAVHHRPGVLHANADALGRAPQLTDADNTGASLDLDSDPIPPSPT